MKSLFVFPILCLRILVSNTILGFLVLLNHCVTGPNLFLTTNMHLCTPQQIVDLFLWIDLQMSLHLAIQSGMLCFRLPHIPTS